MKTHATWLPPAAALLSLVSLATALPAQEKAEGPRLRSSAVEITLGGRVHTQFNTTSVESQPMSEWLLRRVRLDATVKVNEVVSGKVQPEFAGDRVVVQDAYLQLTFSPAVQVLAGRAKRPFSRIDLSSSNRMLPIERGVRIRGLSAREEYALVNGLHYSDRDVGLQLSGAPEGAPLGLGYAAGIFRGPLHGAVGSLDTYQLAARVTARPSERLQVGAGWSGRDFADETGDAVRRLERGNAFEVDVEYGSYERGFHLLGEVAAGDVDPVAGDGFTAAQAWLGYRSGEVSRSLAGVEPIFRVSWAEVGDEAGAGGPQGGTLLTPGVNLYFGGLNRVMLNYDLWLPGGETASREGSFKAMFQMAF